MKAFMKQMHQQVETENLAYSMKYKPLPIAGPCNLTSINEMTFQEVVNAFHALAVFFKPTDKTEYVEQLWNKVLNFRLTALLNQDRQWPKLEICKVTETVLRTHNNNLAYYLKVPQILLKINKHFSPRIGTLLTPESIDEFFDDSAKLTVRDFEDYLLKDPAELGFLDQDKKKT